MAVIAWSWNIEFCRGTESDNQDRAGTETETVSWWVGGHVDLCQFLSACACKLVDWSQKEKQKQANTTPNVVIVVVSHYQSLQIIVFLSQACLLEIYLFCKIWLEEFWKLFSAEADFLWNSICLSFFTAGWYVVTKGNSLSAVLCFCSLRADCLKSKVTSYKELSIYFFGYR